MVIAERLIYSLFNDKRDKKSEILSVVSKKSYIIVDCFTCDFVAVVVLFKFRKK